MHAAVLSTKVVGLSSKAKTPVRRYADASGPLKNTVLHDLHVAKGAKMAPFCGWHMPIEYPDGVLNSHLHCRQKAGLFDVSHMGQLLLKGPDRVKFIESLTVADVAEMPENEIKLSVFTNEKGGIKDDLMITNARDHLYLVVNAGCADKDIAHLKQHLAAFQKKGGNASMEVISDKFSLVALQGPSAAGILELLTVKEDLKSFYFMNSRTMLIKGVGDCRVGRSGYTGEDGFEISVPHEKVTALAEILLSHPDVRLVGLGARDSLRLEAGLCLYGNDIDETTTPVEAQLVWTIGKRRREQGGFLGASVIQSQLKNGVSRKRVGLVLDNGIARPGHHDSPTVVSDAAGKKVGHITSGTFSPILKKGIAMAYLDAKAGPNVKVEVRGKHFSATVSKMPFVKQNYWKKPEEPKKK